MTSPRLTAVRLTAAPALPAAAFLALVGLSVLAACSVQSPIPGGGYRINELPPQERALLARPRFEQFPPYAIIAPEAVAPDLSSHPQAREFRTALRTGAEKGPAFAGHLAVASWGCGTGCQQWAFIDARTGKVIWGPRTEAGAEYIQDSRLFVANPDAEPEKRRFYIWTGEGLEEMRG